jgi:hypothetical protein
MRQNELFSMVFAILIGEREGAPSGCMMHAGASYIDIHTIA